MIRSSTLFAVLLLCCGHVAKAGSWMEPYTPSKLEWLAVQLNAMERVDITPPGADFSISFDWMPPDIIHIYTFYMPSTDRALLNTVVEHKKQSIERLAKYSPFQMKIKIKETTKMMGQKSRMPSSIREKK